VLELALKPRSEIPELIAGFYIVDHTALGSTSCSCPLPQVRGDCLKLSSDPLLEENDAVAQDDRHAEYRRIDRQLASFDDEPCQQTIDLSG
jgi:hypothetical protein